MTATAVHQGTLLSGKYRLLSLLGQGGMGSVWRAEHLELSAPVAVKLIDPGIAKNPEALARFQREAKAAAALRSPHVVQILDYGVDEASATPFIVMELMEGESLASRLERGPLPPKVVSDVFVQVARALTKAHAAGIVHRDLKPDNIFLVKNDDIEVAKVLDFGIAKAEGVGVAGAATATGMVMGTAYYMSPEQVRGTKDTDFRTDLWAMGVIAHEAITGMRPFDSQTLGDLVIKICMEDIPVPSKVRQVPPGFDAWFSRAVARDPGARFQSARELAESLRDVCAGIESPQITTGMRNRGAPPTGVPTLSAQAAAGKPDPHSGTQLLDTGQRAVDPLVTQPSAVPQKKAPVALFVILSVTFLGGLGAAAFALWPKPEPGAPVAPEPSAVAAAVAELTAAMPPEPKPELPATAPVETSVAAVTAEPRVDVVPVSTAEPEPPKRAARRPAARAPAPPPPDPVPEPAPKRPAKKKSSLGDILDTRK